MLPNKDTIPYVEFSEINKNALLIDIRSAEAFKAFQIPNAVNHCVYEIAFVDNISKAIKNKANAIVVYGEDAIYRGADYAFGKLVAAGFQNVEVLKGGIREWSRIQGIEPPVELQMNAGKRSLSLKKSRVLWFGRNFFNQHYGQVIIKSGYLEVDADGAIECAEVELDMERITCDDLSLEQGRNQLIEHLKSSDFFLTKQHPIASFKYVSGTAIANATVGSVNVDITGEMMIRGITQSLSFPAMLYPVKNGYGLQAQFDFNRTHWNVIYGSGSVFERLGMHVVSDLISLQVQLIFDK